MLAFLWAESENGIIGKNGQLPWHLSADMKYFKQMTTDNTILAGQKTFASFGRPLPNRNNWVLTHQHADRFPKGVKVYNTINAFLKDYQNDSKRIVFIVGGASIYQQLLPYVDRLYKTEIMSNVAGDTKMPPINYSNFKLLSQEKHLADDKNPFDYSFLVYQRIKNG